MATTPSQRLSQLDVTLPQPPTPLAAYVPGVLATPGTTTLFVSGQLPTINGELIAKGSVPKDVDIETAQRCAQQCAINAIAVAAGMLGSPDKVKRVLRLGGFVACDASFTQHPAVINGASLFIGEIFGDAGTHARAAVGVPSLPLGAPVEIEFLFEVDVE